MYIVFNNPYINNTPENYYDAFIGRYNFLEKAKECIDVLMAINHVFPENASMLFKIISYLYIYSITKDMNIIILYNGKDIGKDYPYVGTGLMKYEMVIGAAFHKDWFGSLRLSLDDFELLKDNKKDQIEKPKPQLVKVNFDVVDNSIVFEIKTKKGEKNND